MVSTRTDRRLRNRHSSTARPKNCADSVKPQPARAGHFPNSRPCSATFVSDFGQLVRGSALLHASGQGGPQRYASADDLQFPRIHGAPRLSELRVHQLLELFLTGPPRAVCDHRQPGLLERLEVLVVSYPILTVEPRSQEVTGSIVDSEEVELTDLRVEAVVMVAVVESRRADATRSDQPGAFTKQRDELFRATCSRALVELMRSNEPAGSPVAETSIGARYRIPIDPSPCCEPGSPILFATSVMRHGSCERLDIDNRLVCHSLSGHQQRYREVPSRPELVDAGLSYGFRAELIWVRDVPRHVAGVVGQLLVGCPARAERLE